MSTRIEEVQRLKEQEGRRQAILTREKESGNSNRALKEKIWIERDMIKTYPWLLAVAGKFQKGDAMALDDGITWLENLLAVKELRPGAEDQCKELVRVIASMRRMAEAAAIMEEE